MDAEGLDIDVEKIDLTDASIWEQGAPQGWLDALRAEAPVRWHPESDGPGFWAVTGHDHVRAISTDPASYSSWVGGPLRLDPDPDTLEQMRMVIIGMDPPDHRAFRSLVSMAFTPRTIRELTGALDAETRRVVGELRDRDRCEVVADVAARIPMWAISELMGIPEGDRQRLYELSHCLIDDQDPEVAPTPDTALQATAEIFGYAYELAARERAQPTGSITTTLLNAEVEGRRLTDLEFTLFFVFLIVAGNETSRTATTQGLLALLEHPDQLAALRANPALLEPAVEEILRWQPPIHHFRRTATRDLKLGGTAIAEGDKVIMWYPGANRDPGVFDAPHTFRIDRSPNPQLAFGVGEHFCLGANLARVTLRLVLGELLATIDDIELLEPPRRLRSNLINGIKEMHVGYRLR